MEAFIKYLVNGITLGGMYALIALGYTMVYGIIKLINFAHGDILMVGAFLGFFFLSTLAFTGWTPLVLLLPTTLLIGWWASSAKVFTGHPHTFGTIGLLLVALIVGLAIPPAGNAQTTLRNASQQPVARVLLPARDLPMEGLQLGIAFGPSGTSRTIHVKQKGLLLGQITWEPATMAEASFPLPSGGTLMITRLSDDLPDVTEAFLFPTGRALALYLPWAMLLVLPLAMASGLKRLPLVATTFIGGGLLGWAVTLHLPFALLAAMSYSALLGVSIERFAYKPLRAAPRIAALITAIGVSLFLENAGIIIWGDRDKSYSDMNPTVGFLISPTQAPLTLGPVTIGVKELLILLATFALMAALQYLVMRTRIGKAMRAVSMDRDAARLMGINVDGTISATFAIGSALAAAAGVFWGLYYNTLNPDMGIWPGVKAFVAAVLGGIGSIPGAMAGGLVMGIAENLVVGYLASSYRDAIAFTILIVILLIRPTGLFGSKAGEKV
ncbi:MAG: hypothetical protein GEEBNDBF_01871 [bacterium]|nr:hypothetical protein [bacterium]